MTQSTKAFMGLGAHEAHFKPRAHLIDLFTVGSSLLYYRGEEWWNTGVITEPAKIENEEIVVAGPGLEWWGGEDDKIGAVRDPRGYTAQRTDQIVDQLLFRESGTRWLQPGVINLGNVIGQYDIFYEPARRAIRRLAAFTRTEYRVNPDGTFDWAGNVNGGVIGNTRSTVLSKRAKTAESIEYEPTAFNAVGKVIVMANGEGDNMLVREAVVALPADWRDFFNNPYERDFIVDAPNTESVEEADFVASAQAGIRGKIHRKATVTLKTDALLDAIEPGDTVPVHKPFVLYDNANSVAYKGRNYPALMMRVQSITATLGTGWKVVHRSPTGVLTDVTSLLTDVDGSARAELECSSDPYAFFTEINTDTPLDARRSEQEITPGGTDTSIPKAPTGLAIAVATYKDQLGHQRARLTFSWLAVTQNMDNSPIADLNEYVVQFRRVSGSATAWETVTVQSDTLTASVENLPVGVTWEAQVRATDFNGNESTWAPVAPVNSASTADTTPPPAPKAPVATGSIRQVFVVWERKDAANNPMPADLRWYEIHASQVSGFTPDATTKVGETQGTVFTLDRPAGNWYFKLLAVDYAGNVSAASAQSGVVTVRLVSAGDVAVDAISAANIAAGAVGPTELAFGSVSIAHLVVGNFQNDFENPSFEVDNDQTTYNGLARTLDVANARTGSYAAKYVGTGVLATVNFIGRKRSARQGDEFYLEGFYKTTAAPTGFTGAQFYVEFLDANDTRVGITLVQAAGGANVAYQQRSGVAVAPAGTVWARPWVETAITTGTVWFDDVLFRRTIVSAYISDLAVITAKIADLAVTTAKINDLSVTTAKIGLLAVGTAQIADLAVTSAKIDTLVANKITAGDILAILTVTSGTIRTAASGARAEITSNGIDFFSPLNLGGFTGTVIDWTRDAMGDSSHFARLAAGWDNTLSLAWLEAQAKTVSQRALVLLQVLDNSGSIEQRITLDESNGWMILDADYAGSTRGRLVLHKGVQASGFTAEFDLNDSVLKIGDEGMIYSNAKYHGFGSVPANGKPTPATIGYDDSFNANCAVPYPWMSIGNESNAMASPSAAAIGRGGFTLQLLNHAGSTQAFDVFILPIAPF